MRRIYPFINTKDVETLQILFQQDYSRRSWVHNSL